MAGNRFFHLILIYALLVFLIGAGAVAAKEGGKIIHDTEYYILKAQNGEQWATDDKEVDKKLAEFREKNNGKPPNILYILIDDVGFGDLEIPELNAIRGYKTPHINKLADESMRFARMGAMGSGQAMQSKLCLIVSITGRIWGQ